MRLKINKNVIPQWDEIQNFDITQSIKLNN